MLTSSQEDYLEAILSLTREVGVARVRDIAGRLGVSKSAVTAALKHLAEHEMVHYDPYELVALTERGQQAAERVAERHRVLRQFLQAVLGLDADAAEANACRMEHNMDDVALERLSQVGEFIETCPAWQGDEWLKQFRAFCSGPGKRPGGKRKAPVPKGAGIGKRGARRQRGNRFGGKRGPATSASG